MTISTHRLLAFALLASSLHAAPAHAGLMWFSRANCVNNESISWDWLGQAHWLRTDSHHYFHGVAEPVLSSGWEHTARSAAIHWGEGLIGGFSVEGDHWRWLSGYGVVYLGQTRATDCNLGALSLYW